MAERRGEFLIEVGCEELPAGWLPGLTEEWGRWIEDLCRREGLEPGGCVAHSTPRRLAAAAELRVRQADREEWVWGPALTAARDAAGQWTKAAEGFARKCGVPVTALEQAAKDPAKPAEIHLLFRRQLSGRDASEVLPGVIAGALRGLSFPKRMSWDAWLDDGKGAFPFGRPIRWLVALFDGRVVPFTIYAHTPAGRGAELVRSGDQTRGHRFLPRGRAGRPVAVTGLADLRAKLRAQAVVLDAAERAALIEQRLAALGAAAQVGSDHGLREEWPQLVEHPNVVVGQVPAEFRELPDEVLETVLVHHQKYLPLRRVQAAGAHGQPPACLKEVVGFAALTNTDDRVGPEIVRGMERVCTARFRDARFFYQDDRKRPLASRVDDLRGVTFHQKLGGYHDKAGRLVALVDRLAQAGWLAAGEHAQAREAALLCKADLTTSMVREFPELQGVIGGLYLKAEGAPAALWQAVYWHYHPIAMGEHDPPLAEALGGAFAAVALADKLDTLAGYFLIGLEPKGGSDPFGLRRAAQGAVRLLLDFWSEAPRPDLRALLAPALAGYPPSVAGDRPRAAEALARFLTARLEHVLGARGLAGDEIAAVLAAPARDALGDLCDAQARARALQAVRSEAPEAFAALAEAFKRAHNILAGQQPAAAVAPALFERESERTLHTAIERLRAEPSADPQPRLRALAGLRGAVDGFFAREQDGGVMVLADDPALRGNRLALLAAARALFHDIADISKLGGTQ